MSLLPGKWYTIGGRPVIYPPAITLADIQAAFPEFTVYEGITPEARAAIDRDEAERKAQEQEMRDLLTRLRWPIP